MTLLAQAAADGVTIPISAIMGAVVVLGSAIGLLFKLLMGSKDKAIADLESRMKSLQEIADESTRAARDMGNFMRAQEGKAPIIPVAPVISESHSPSTKRQRDEAHIATLRADLAATKLAVGLPPRTEPVRAKE